MNWSAEKGDIIRLSWILLILNIYKRKFNVDIWKQDKAAAKKRKKKVERESLESEKTGFEWNENEVI